MTEENKNPWTLEDEKEHFPSKMEWWCAIAFLNSIEENKRWSFKITFAEWLESFKKPGSLLNMTTAEKHTDSFFSLYSHRDIFLNFFI